MEYLEKGVLPLERKLAVQFRIRAARFTLVNETLYKRGFMLLLLNASQARKETTSFERSMKGLVVAILEQVYFCIKLSERVFTGPT